MYLFWLFWVPDFLVWILGIFVLLYIYGTRSYSKLSSHGYTGPKPKAFIGNIDLALQKGHWGAWDLTGKQTYGKVFGMYEGHQPTIVVFDTDFIKQVLVKNFSNFPSRRDMIARGEVMAHSLLDLTGPEWKRVRGLCSPFFTTGKLKRNTELLRDCIDRLTNKFQRFAEERREVDVRDVVGAFTLEAICLTAFGLQIDSQSDTNNKILQTMKQLSDINFNQFHLIIRFFFPFLGPLFEYIGFDMFPKGTIETLCEVTKVAIEERAKSEEEKPDFIQALMKAHEVQEEIESDAKTTISRSKALTDNEIAAQAALFQMAGYDTVNTALSFLLFNLANNPDCQEKLYSEITKVFGEEKITYDNMKQATYIDMCIEESQRLYPPAMRIERKCIRDTSINGHFVPAGTIIIVPTFGLHHDPEFWEDPEKFDPERFSSENRSKIDAYAYQPFGSGPRNCVGMRLALLEVKMAAINLIKHFKVKVGKKTKMPLKLVEGFFPRADGGIWLNLESRDK